MKLGELKVAALKLLFVGYENDIQTSDLTDLSLDENYKSYLFGMNDSINRAFSALEEKGVLPSKSHTLVKSTGIVDGVFIRFNLNDLIDDFFRIDRVIYQNDNGEYNGNFDYNIEENILVLRDYNADRETFRVLYKPHLTRIANDTDVETELEMPDSIANQIPLYIKGDIYREDEPNEASESRNWFESSMDELHKKQANKFSRVKKVFSQTE